MIELNEVYFKYKKDRPILKGISYIFANGGTYIIQGSNGSGKTTLLRALCGLLKLCKGKIVYPPNSVISFLPDNNGIYESMTVLENIKFRISLYKLPYEDLKNAVQESLVSYELMPHKDVFASELSLGMRKKLALICAYIVKPDILILDEPTGGIDDKSRAELIAMLNLLRQENQIKIITSHDINFIENVKAKKIFISDGMLHDEPDL